MNFYKRKKLYINKYYLWGTRKVPKHQMNKSPWMSKMHLTHTTSQREADPLLLDLPPVLFVSVRNPSCSSYQARSPGVWLYSVFTSSNTSCWSANPPKSALHNLVYSHSQRFPRTSCLCSCTNHLSETLPRLGGKPTMAISPILPPLYTSRDCLP